MATTNSTNQQNGRTTIAVLTKRAPSPSMESPAAQKRTKIDSLFDTQEEEDEEEDEEEHVYDLEIGHGEESDEEVLEAFWGNSPRPAMDLLDEEEEEDEEDEEDEEGDMATNELGDKPFRRSLYSELLLSSTLEPDDIERRKIHSSLFDEDTEEDKTTVPLSRPYVPINDEIDALFSSSIHVADEPPEYVLSSAMKMAILNQNQHVTPKYITAWPHFLTAEYFQHASPQDRFIIPPEEEEAIKISPNPYFDAKFSILKNMGSGEFAEVWKTRDLSTDVISAIKKSKVPFVGWEDRWQQLIEVDHLRSVKESKYCVNMMNAWEEHGYLYIQLELCAMGSLDDYLREKNGKVPEDIVWKIFHEIVLGVRDIHKADIVHLDLKPTNILIDDKGHVKIGDFGISVHTPVDMKWVKGEGDRRYMAPDLLREEFDKPADIFSLGLMLLELATDIVLPGTGESWEMLRLGDFSKQKSALSKLSTQMSDMIKWLLTTEAKKRPTIQDILLHPTFLNTQQKGASLLSYVVEIRQAEEAEDRIQHNTLCTSGEKVLKSIIL